MIEFSDLSNRQSVKDRSFFYTRLQVVCKALIIPRFTNFCLKSKGVFMACVQSHYTIQSIFNVLYMSKQTLFFV